MTYIVATTPMSDLTHRLWNKTLDRFISAELARIWEQQHVFNALVTTGYRADRVIVDDPRAHIRYIPFIISKEETAMTNTMEFQITDTKNDRLDAQRIMESFVRDAKTIFDNFKDFTTGHEVAGRLSTWGIKGDSTQDPMTKYLEGYCDAYDAKAGKYVSPKVTVGAYTTTLEHDGMKATAPTPAPVRVFLSDYKYGSFSYLKN